MGWGKFEFHDDERDIMNQAFDFMTELLGPKKLKPPKKDPKSGKWHFYIESPDHKQTNKRVKY